MTSPTALSHRVIYLRPRAVCTPPNSMALLALVEMPIYVSNGIRTVSDVAQCALQHAAVGVDGRGSTCPGPQLRSACLFAKRLMTYW